MRDSKKVLVLGASDNPSRYSHMAMVSLERHGHEPVLVNPRHDQIEGRRVYASVDDAPDGVDTVTLYLGPGRLAPLIESIVALRPRRVIANPGAESEAMRLAAERRGIEYLEACTLVLLSTGRF